MPSYIFNSESPVRKLCSIGAWTAGIVGAYALYAQYLATPVEFGQTDQVTNRMRAEHYVDAPDQTDILVVGSSLAWRLPAEALGPKVSNVALAGGSPLTGLAIADRTGTAPRTVIIETNILSRSIDQAFVDSLFQQPIARLRSQINVFGAAFQPVNLLFGALMAGHGKRGGALPPPDARREMIERAQRDLSQPLDGAALGKQIELMAELVDRLRGRGSIPAFVEMPIEPALATQAQPAQIRAALLNRFPPDRFCWLLPQLPNGPMTTDGLHLVADDAGIVAHQLVEQVARCPGILG